MDGSMCNKRPVKWMAPSGPTAWSNGWLRVEQCLVKWMAPSGRNAWSNGWLQVEKCLVKWMALSGTMPGQMDGFKWTNYLVSCSPNFKYSEADFSKTNFPKRCYQEL